MKHKSNLTVDDRLKIFDELLHTNEGASKEVYCRRLNNEAGAKLYPMDSTCVIYSDVRLVKELLKSTGVKITKDDYGNFHLSDKSVSIVSLRRKERSYRKNGNLLDFVNHSSGLPQIWGKKLLDGENPSSKQRTILAFEPLFDESDYILSGENRLPNKLKKLYEAALNETAVSVKIDNFNKETYEAIIFPEFLKQYRRNWYVFGMIQRNCDSDVEFARLPVNRLSFDMKVKKNIAFQYSDVDYDEYFDYFIGVDNMSGGREPEKVILSIKNNMVDRVQMGVLGNYNFKEEADFHEEDRKVFSVKLIINKELERVLLQYASDIKVLQPESLVKVIKKEFQKALSLYE